MSCNVMYVYIYIYTHTDISNIRFFHFYIDGGQRSSNFTEADSLEVRMTAMQQTGSPWKSRELIGIHQMSLPLETPQLCGSPC